MPTANRYICKNKQTKLKELNLPQYSFKITGDEGSEMIFDELRRKYAAGNKHANNNIKVQDNFRR